MKHLLSIGFIGRLGLKRLVVFMVSLLAVLSVGAQDVSYSQARDVAAGFFKSRGMKPEAAAVQHARRKAPLKAGENSPYYIFNNADATAFVVVSGDSRTQQVLAYSTDGGFDEGNVAPGAQYFLDLYEDYILALQDTDVKPARSRAAALYPVDGGVYLKTALWDQSAKDFWGSQCPTIGNAHTYAGCVATAMAILMRHHGWAKGRGSKTNERGDLDFAPTANFGATDYDIASLPTNQDGDKTWTDAQKESVAKLLYHCGVAANMGYGVNSSGAVLDVAVAGLYRYFGYTLGQSISLHNYGYNVSAWVNTIKKEINGGNPVLYEGNSTTEGGHAFVCEGYDSEDRLYFNYGWSGYCNGFYSIWPGDPDDPSRYPADLNRFPNGQSAKIGIRPCEDADTRTLGDVKFDALTLNGNAYPHIGEGFALNFYGVSTITCSDLNCMIGVFFCKGDGSSITKIGDFDYPLALNYSYSFVKGYFTIPYGTTIDEGDYIGIYSSTDNGTTWKEVECYDKNAGRISVADAFDLSPMPHFKMYNKTDSEGKLLLDETGIKLKNFNVGNNFYLEAFNWFNCLPVTFTGHIAVFLCDKDGNRVLSICDNQFNLDPNRGYYNYNFLCAIPSGTELAPGDNLRLFSRFDGEDVWMPVECETAEKGSVEIPAEFIPTTKTISFSNPFATFCSLRNDLDFTGVNGIYAYKAVQKDGESIALVRVTKVKAGEGVLLRGIEKTGEGYSAAAAVSTVESGNEGNLFVGVTSDTKLAQESDGVTKYVLGSYQGEVGFYVADGVSVKAGQAYLAIPGSPASAPRQYSLTFVDDEMAGITCVKEDRAAAEGVYTLQGVKVGKPEKGIYIINGKKYIKK